MEQIINNIGCNVVIKILIIALIFDIFLGSLRAIKEKKWNSTIGINGMLRKVGMTGSMVFLFLTDYILNLNFIGSVPKDILDYIGINKIGSCEFFGIMFILYECTSILKNMVLCDIPCPKWLKKKAESLLKNMTTELPNNKK